MSIPEEWTTVTLSGTYLNTNGEPEVGKIEFKIHPNKRIKVLGAGTVIIPEPIRVELDETGSFTIEIPSTNDPNIDPHFRWHVRERFFPNKLFSYFIQIPYDAESLNIADLEHDDVGAPLG